MKKLALKLSAAASAICLLTMPAAAAEDIMTLRMAADKIAFTTDEIAKGDSVVHGNLFIDNYTGLSEFRLILKSDDPISIENGDYTRDATEKGPDGELHLSYFENYSRADYTQKSPVFPDLSNIILWYGPENQETTGDFLLTGKLRKADEALLKFDVRIPKDTKAGDYKCYISTEVQQERDNPPEYDFFAYNEKIRYQPNENIILKPLTLSVYTRGDVNGNGEIGVDDAQVTLNYYVTTVVAGNKLTDEQIAEMLGTSSIQAAKLAADASLNNEIGADDAQLILRYYTESITGKTPSWDSLTE